MPTIEQLNTMGKNSSLVCSREEMLVNIQRLVTYIYDQALTESSSYHVIKLFVSRFMPAIYVDTSKGNCWHVHSLTMSGESLTITMGIDPYETLLAQLDAYHEQQISKVDINELITRFAERLKVISEKMRAVSDEVKLQSLIVEFDRIQQWRDQWKHNINAEARSKFDEFMQMIP